MSTAESQVKVKIGGDAKEATAAFNSVQQQAQTMRTSVVGSMRSMANGVSSVVMAFDKVKGAMEKAMAPVIVIRAAIDAFNWLRKAIKGADEATRELGKSALDAAKAIKETGIDADLYNAVKNAADAAKVSADELSAKLKEYKEHKITFDELAASIGKTATQLKASAEVASIGKMGAQYLAQHEANLQAGEEARKASDINSRGISLIIKDIIKLNNSGRGAETAPLWDILAKESAGNKDLIYSLWQNNKAWYQRDLNMYGAWGPQQVNAAVNRYDAVREAERERREREIAEHDAKVRAERAAKAAEEKAKADKEAAEKARRAAEEKARADKAAADEARRAQEAADREAARKQSVIDARDSKIAAETVKMQESINKITVSAPAAASGLGTQGGLIGADMAAVNRENMDRERNRKLDEITKNFTKMMYELDKQTKKLLGEA